MDVFLAIKSIYNLKSKFRARISDIWYHSLIGNWILPKKGSFFDQNSKSILPKLKNLLSN